MLFGVDVWTSIPVAHHVPNIPPTDADDMKLYGNNVQAKNAIIFCLSQS